MSDRATIDALAAEFRNAKRTADRAIAQVADGELHASLNPWQNGIAVTIQHVAGNLRSRWADFLTADGEKPGRDRDGEFVDRRLTRAELADLWDGAWAVALAALAGLTDADLGRTVTIRGEPHTVLQAVLRNLTHAVWHVSQIALIAKHYVGPDWAYLTVPPGGEPTTRQSGR